MVESSGLLNRRTGNNRYRGFKSLPLRHFHHMPVNIDYYTHSLFAVMHLDNGKG